MAIVPHAANLFHPYAEPSNGRCWGNCSELASPFCDSPSALVRAASALGGGQG